MIKDHIILYASLHRQASTYHGFSYTRRLLKKGNGALALATALLFFSHVSVLVRGKNRNTFNVVRLFSYAFFTPFASTHGFTNERLPPISHTPINHMVNSNTVRKAVKQ